MSLRRSLAKLRSLFYPQGVDLPEEIESHLAMEEADNLARGMTPEEARHAARQRLGNITLTTERARDMWTWTNLETLKMDAF